jgi:hypothetical protein
MSSALEGPDAVQLPTPEDYSFETASILEERQLPNVIQGQAMTDVRMSISMSSSAS